MNGMLKYGGCSIVVIALILLNPVAAAGDREPVNVVPALSNYVLVANGVDTSSVSITVYNETGTPLDGLFVEFLLSDPALGGFTPVSVNTSGVGIAETSFKTAKKSGIADISARVYYELGGTQYSKVFTVGEISVLDPIPDIIYFNGTAPNGWLVANATDHCSEIVRAYNTSFMSGFIYPIPDLNVVYSVVEPGMGSFNPAGTSTDSSGTAQSVFTSSYKSGYATLMANITYPVWGGSGTTTVQYIQKIDHDTPAKIPSGGITLPPDGEASVGSNASIGVLIEDSHGNPVDNRRETDEGRDAEKVTFSVTGSPGAPNSRAYFIPGAVDNITIQVNGTGWAMATLRLDTFPGPNIIKIDPLTFVPDLKRTIYGIADGIPCSISARIFTNEQYERDWVLADGIMKFYILYQVDDEFGNGVQLKNVTFSTSLGEGYTAVTNATGGIQLEYGPKSDVGNISITATSLDNSSVTRVDIVRFVNLTANDMLFTATPQSMASYDAGYDKAYLYGYVLDSEGNSIVGERIHFTISNIWYDENPNWTVAPSLENGTVIDANAVDGVTTEEGYTVVYLTPCTFSVDEFAPGYDSTATGHCEVVAEWTDPEGVLVRRTQEFTFKNYPYLSVETLVSPQRVNVTGTVDVSVILRGDGFALRPKPIDVMLVLDRSLSMNENDMEGGQTRLQALKTASRNFVDQMNSTSDRVGMLPYSSTVYTSSPPYCALGTPFATVKSRIQDLTPVMYTASRLGLKTAIEKMNQMPNSDPRTIRTIIFMTDGEYNYYGDPLARGTGYNSVYRDSGSDYYDWTTTKIDRHTWFTGLGGHTGSPADENINTNQNMSVYANNSRLRIYTISFSPDIVEGSETWKVMDNLANSTGGKHFHATSAQQLYDVYEQIAGELKTAAGVNTTMDCSFDNITVKNVSMPGESVFSYQYVNGISTFIKKWKNGQPLNYSETIDQTDDWNTDQSIDFDVGTIEINDNWQATFRLQVLKEGDIHVFGPDSIIQFDDGTKSLEIPDTVINAISNLVNQSFEYGELYEEDINVTELSGTIYEWSWNRYYTGNYPIEEYYFISLDGGYQWTLVGEDLLSPEEIDNEPVGRFRYDILNILPHGVSAQEVTVDFKIKAYAIDVASPRIPRGPQIVRLPTNSTYITLE